MNDETFRMIIARIQQMNYALVQLETGIRLSKELYDRWQIAEGDPRISFCETIDKHRKELAKIQRLVDMDFDHQAQQQQVMVNGEAQK